jgi:hypothetical protein
VAVAVAVDGWQCGSVAVWQCDSGWQCGSVAVDQVSQISVAVSKNQ